MIELSFLQGRDLEPLPYESMESVGARLAWRNGKPLHHIIRDALARVGNSSWVRSIQHDATEIGTLAHLCGWGNASVRARYLVGRLEPYRYGSLHAGFRFCPICLEAGYHSYYFEWDFIQTCPLHGCALTAECQSCGAAVEYRWKEDSLARLGYRCLACRQFLAGVEPDLAEHLKLRRQTALIQARFRPFDIFVRDLAPHFHVVYHTLRVFETMECDRLRPWCHAEQVRRIGMHISHFMGSRTGAAQYGGIVHVKWRMHLYSSAPDRLTWKESRASALDSAQCVYRATLRRLEHWIFGRSHYAVGIQCARSRFMASENENASIAAWPPLVLTYALLRHTLEGSNFAGSGRNEPPTLSHFIVQLEDWHVADHVLRPALRAYVLALFAIIHATVCRHQDSTIENLFSGAGFNAESFVPIFRVPSKAECRNGEGAVLFPVIEGMPLWPFVRADHPLMDVPAPDGTECNLFARSRHMDHRN